MLNYAKLLQAIQSLDHNYQITVNAEIQHARQCWSIFADNVAMQACLKLQAKEHYLPVPQDDLNKIIPVSANMHEYEVIGIDGSQIYPDRHSGCFYSLINVGTVAIHYAGQKSAVSMGSDPFIIQPMTDIEQWASVETTNARRHEFELTAAITHQEKKEAAVPRIYLFDGSLIFWHLVSQDQSLIDFFFPRSIHLLEQFCQKNMLVGWYISAPKSKELVSLLQQAMTDFPHAFPKTEPFKFVRDEALLYAILPPWHRTPLFETNVAITQDYPREIRPYFCYINIDNEMVRLEMPAWIAQNEQQLQILLNVVIDQVKKGYGYPVALAEAHEQAVVKSADRDFFYHILSKYDLSSKKNSISQKKSKKWRMSI